MRLTSPSARPGLRVGRDIAITAFDDTPWFALLDPPLSAIAQDAPGLGRQALDALRARIAGEPVADVVLPVQLVVRSSCALPSARTLADRRSS